MKRLRLRAAKKHRLSRARLAFEMGMVALVAIDIILLGYELLAHPSHVELFWIEHIDLAIACLFLTEFVVLMVRSGRPLHFVRHNWLLLLASIPIAVPGTQLMRILRLERLLRLIRIFDHGYWLARRTTWR